MNQNVLEKTQLPFYFYLTGNMVIDAIALAIFKLVTRRPLYERGSCFN